MNRRLFSIILMMAALSSATCQEEIQGCVSDGDTKLGVPYAAIHVLDTCVSTYCNEAGEFLLHIPQGMTDAKVVISSLGYCSDTIEARKLAKRQGKVILEPRISQLRPVEILEYRSARKLMEEVYRRIPENYRAEEAVGIWYYRNRQMLNDGLYVKSEGLIRKYMQPYNSKRIKVHDRSADRWDEMMYRFYQRLDTVIVCDTAYWRSLIGPDSLDGRMDLKKLKRPSNCWQTIMMDFVNYGNNKGNHLFSKKSTFMMEAFSQDNKDYYRVTVSFRPRHCDTCLTAVFVITKDELAVVDLVLEQPRFSYVPKMYFSLLNPYCEDIQSTTRMHYRYHKYNGRYQIDYIQREYEYWYQFSSMAKENGCPSSHLKISGKEECILSEHTYEGVEEYKKRYVNNDHPRTEENIRETERILRQPHNKIRW